MSQVVVSLAQVVWISAHVVNSRWHVVNSGWHVVYSGWHVVNSCWHVVAGCLVFGMFWGGLPTFVFLGVFWCRRGGASEECPEFGLFCTPSGGAFLEGLNLDLPPTCIFQISDFSLNPPAGHLQAEASEVIYRERRWWIWIYNTLMAVTG